MLMLQSLNACIFVLGAAIAWFAKWGLWIKGRPMNAPTRPYLRENLGDHMVSISVVVTVMVLWLAGKLGGVAKEFSDILPSSLSFGDQIEVAVWSSFIAGLLAELAAPKLIGWVISKLPARSAEAEP